MAKKTVNKSEEVRTVLKATPTASAKEVVATLKQKGIDVSEYLVYGVKQDLAKKAKKAKATAKAASPVKVAASSPKIHLGVGASIALIKTTAEKVGGWDALKEIVDALV